MAQTSWPYENQDTTETEFSQWARNIGEGVKENTGNELLVTADGTGMAVSVGSGQALIRGHYYSSTGAVSLTIATSDPSDPRIDVVVLELDPTANTTVLKVLTGTPGAVPVAPALTETDAGVYQMAMANVQVDAAALAIDSGDLTDRRLTLISLGTVSNSITAIEGDITTLESDVGTLQTDVAALQTPAVNAKTANYTLVVGDRGEFITCDGTFTLTIPSATFSAGDRIDFVNIGTGVITFAGSGVTVNSVDGALTIDTQWAGATFFFTSSSAGVLIGRLA